MRFDGSVEAWGDNFNGQCNVPAPNTGFVAIAAGWFFSLGIRSDGSIEAWGINFSGQCNVPEPNIDFVAIAAGTVHSLGLKADGSVVAWGANDDKQCIIPSPNSDFVAIAGGYSHSIGLKLDGSIVVWGSDLDGLHDVPKPNAGFGAIAAGSEFSLALRGDHQSAVGDAMIGRTRGGDHLRILSVTPNPCLGSPEILFDALSAGRVTLDVLDVTGRYVGGSVLGSFGPGKHRVAWDSSDIEGMGIESGLYFLRLRGVAGESRAVRVLRVL
ncbi:MAG: hypothetical protein KAY32_07105 [Candidatus Eisenbacteria sp.]|nr:hypothetical protein [Candidatus Eisenbacteria bacterium]